ncbi:GDSL-type esterase/lipase family protein [Paenibacillus sp. HWE-109]|uniref:GDSL-type esterase/lipase family protein n=1 Tax=Paenibacillus sp. HWE-109 TaxID=1306526 RepID=UPI001EDE5ACC|nr:GDSL-type esterase/lipase family protein [Paenibacillus sp. HWE-109]UKS27955.1 GDSL-type esterase/lipase family protein [Paenibacillus sp. HWE-109]
MKPFARFRSRLKAKRDDMGERAVVYVALGDSVTQGIMEAGAFEYESVYHNLVKKRIEHRYPGTVINVINSGVGGDTAHESRKRWERDVLLYQPDLVTIKFGLNDMHQGMEGLGRYIDSIQDLVDCIRKETNAEVLLMTPSMAMKHDNRYIPDGYKVYVADFLKAAHEGVLEAYARSLRVFAETNQIPFLDVYAMWEQMEREGIDIHERLTNGLNHPDRKFHAELADAIETLLFQDEAGDQTE